VLVRTVKQERRYELEASISFEGFHPDATDVEAANRWPYDSIPVRDQGQPCRLGEMRVIAMHIVFDLMHTSGFVGKGPLVSGRSRVGMEIRDKHIAARPTDAGELLIGAGRVRQVSQYQPAPHHVKTV
jgi:hypothetical protein